MPQPPPDGHTGAVDDATVGAERTGLRARLQPFVLRHGLLRRALGVQLVYRDAGGGLVGAGLSYAALFALIPTFVLVIAGIYLLIDDARLRQDAVDIISEAFPAAAGFTDSAVEQARDLATVGGLIAVVGFAWGASGLYLNLTRAMERFFPGERVSGALARALGVLLVLVLMFGVLAAVFVAGVISVIARALQLDTEWVLTVGGTAATFVVSGAIVYAIYRVVPSNPPTTPSALTPAVLVGIVIALMTLLYSALSPWLVSGFQAFGVAASVFVALVWLRVMFLAMVYGAALARYNDHVAAAGILGAETPDLAATRYLLEEEATRGQLELDRAREMEQRQAAAALGGSGRHQPGRRSGRK